MDPISSSRSNDTEEIVAESSPRGSRWTIEKRGDSQRLLTLSVSEEDYSTCAKVETTWKGRLKRSKVVPWHTLHNGNYVLLGDFWPIRLKESELLYDRPRRVDAIVKVKRGGRSMIKVQVAWVATNAVAHHELHVDKVLSVPLGELAIWNNWNPPTIDKLAGLSKIVRASI